MTDITTPPLGESVTEATVARWTKKAGDAVKKDEVLVELDTYKVSLEVAAPADGVLEEIVAAEGATVTPGGVLGRVSAGGAGKAAAPAQPAAAAAPAGEAQPEPVKSQPPPTSRPLPDLTPSKSAPQAAPAVQAEPVLAPSAQRVVAENNLDAAAIAGTGKDGRITKGDALAALESRSSQPARRPQPVLVWPAPRPCLRRQRRGRGRRRA